MPFLPLAQRPSGAWWFWCPNLGLDGRCTDYDNRPNTCRDFVAASDSLCIHHGAPEGVDMTAIASEAAPVEYVDRILPLGAALKATAWL